MLSAVVGCTGVCGNIHCFGVLLPPPQLYRITPHRDSGLEILSHLQEVSSVLYQQTGIKIQYGEKSWRLEHLRYYVTVCLYAHVVNPIM